MPIDLPTRLAPRLVADRNLGAVRVNFRYASFQSMMAAHSEKAGRDQYFDSQHETYGFRLHEIDPFVLDLQYQPATLEWTTAAGAMNQMTFDFAVETQDHDIVLGEDKASDEYFDNDPELTERLDFAEAHLEKWGAKLQRRVAGGLPKKSQRLVVKSIFDARRTEFSDDIAARVQRAVLSAGGTLPLGPVLAVIGEHPARALDMARAMMHRRVISMPLASPPMSDTPVTIPRPAVKGALRAFLAQFITD